MKQPVIYRSAQIRLHEIWDYTFEKWGEEQADKYLRELGACMNGIDSQRSLWCSVQDKRLSRIFFVRCAHHYIFLKVASGFAENFQDQITVARGVVHEERAWMERLQEVDLRSQ